MTFIVEVSELPGCMADGKTYCEAVSIAELVVHQWIDTATEIGGPIPHPGGRLMCAW
jgi:predicted RNase H-like HicB family nuclease